MIITYRTALPATRLAGSIAALQLRDHVLRHGREPIAESLVLTHLLVDRAVALGSVRPELRVAISDRLRIEIWDEGRGTTRIAVGGEARDLRARLDMQTMSWGHHREPQAHEAVLWFDVPAPS